MKIYKVKQFGVYKNEDEYYVCLGLRNNLVYLNLRSMEGELKRIKQFVNKSLEIKEFSDYIYEIYQSQTFEDYLYYTVSPIISYYVTDKLDFDAPMDEKSCMPVDLKYRVKKVDIPKGIVKTWLLKNQIVNKNIGGFVTVKDILSDSANAGYIRTYSWKKEEMLQAQKYYMKEVFEYINYSNVEIYRDTNYLYFVYRENNIRFLHYKIPVTQKKLEKVRHFINVVYFSPAHSGKVFDISGKEKVENFTRL